MTVQPESHTDKVARFGCGALIGVVLVLGTLLGRTFYPILREPLETSPAFVWAFSVGLPLLVGAVSVVAGWRFPETIAEFLLKR